MILNLGKYFVLLLFLKKTVESKMFFELKNYNLKTLWMVYKKKKILFHNNNKY